MLTSINTQSNVYWKACCSVCEGVFDGELCVVIVLLKCLIHCVPNSPVIPFTSG